MNDLLHMSMIGKRLIILDKVTSIPSALWLIGYVSTCGAIIELLAFMFHVT